GPWLKRMDKAKAAQKLSRSALESLAIIAYKQPLVRAEIEEIRGVETSGVLRTLCERKLVRIVGRKDVPGRPIMYGTTKFFLEHFGLQDLSQLPPLREFKELGDSEQALLPIEEESLTVIETSEPPYSDELSAPSDLAESQDVADFDQVTNEALLEEPVQQAGASVSKALPFSHYSGHLCVTRRLADPYSLAHFLILPEMGLS